MEIYDDGYLFSDDKTKIKLNAVHTLLRQSHWAKERPLEAIAATIEHSFCCSVFDAGGTQIGFARVLTDFAVYSLILDVIVDQNHRGQGIGKKLVEFIVSHPRLNKTSLVLWTKYAKNLYTRYGFQEENQYAFLFKRP